MAEFCEKCIRCPPLFSVFDGGTELNFVIIECNQKCLTFNIERLFIIIERVCVYGIVPLKYSVFLVTRYVLLVNRIP